MPRTDTVHLNPDKFEDALRCRRINRTELAAAIHVSESTVRRAMRGGAISRIVAANMARALRVPLSELSGPSTHAGAA